MRKCEHGHRLSVVGVDKTGYCRECRREISRRYYKSAKGQAYRRSASWKAKHRTASRKYKNSPKGRATIQRFVEHYRRSPARKATVAKYDKSEKGRRKRAKWLAEHRVQQRLYHREFNRKYYYTAGIKWKVLSRRRKHKLEAIRW